MTWSITKSNRFIALVRRVKRQITQIRGYVMRSSTIKQPWGSVWRWRHGDNMSMRLPWQRLSLIWLRTISSNNSKLSAALPTVSLHSASLTLTKIRPRESWSEWTKLILGTITRELRLVTILKLLRQWAKSCLRFVHRCVCGYWKSRSWL